MTSSSHYKDSEIQQVVDHLAAQLRLEFSNPVIEAAFAALSLPRPQKEILTRVRKLVLEETERKMQKLCEHFSKNFDTEPKPRDIRIALEAAGQNPSRLFRQVLLKRLKEENGDRWSQVKLRKRTVRLEEGEDAIWEALQRAFDMNSDDTASMLIRLFVAVTSTGKVPLLDIPFITSALSDSALKRQAGALNFSVNKVRKTRV